MPSPAKVKSKSAVPRFGPKKVFLFLFIFSALAYAYAGFRVYTVGLNMFLNSGGEMFQNLPRHLEDIPSIYTVIDQLLTKADYQVHFSTAGWLFLPFSIWIVWVLWRKSSNTEGRFKRWMMRIFLIPISLFTVFVLLITIAVMIQMAGLLLAEGAVMRRAGSEVLQWTTDLQRPETLARLGAETDPDVIVKKITAHATPPAIVNDDSFFTASVIIAATNAKGSARTAMEAIALPRYLWQNRQENVLLAKLPVSQMLLPGNVLVVRRTELSFAKKVLPILTEKLLNQQNYVHAALLKNNKRRPTYEFLKTEDYGNLRQSQKDRIINEYIRTINTLKSFIAQGGANAVKAREYLPGWEEQYQSFLSHPRNILEEVGTFRAPDTVQILIVDKDNPPAGAAPYSTLFAATLTTSIHESLHYYSHGKKPMDGALEESLTSLFEVAAAKEAVVLMDPLFEIKDFAGYRRITSVMEKVADGVGLAVLADFYFSGDEETFARVFEKKYSLTFSDFTSALTAIHLAKDDVEQQGITDELLSKLE